MQGKACGRAKFKLDPPGAIHKLHPEASKEGRGLPKAVKAKVLVGGVTMTSSYIPLKVPKKNGRPLCMPPKLL